MVLSRMVNPVSATMVPTLTMLPVKVPTLVRSMPAWPAEIVPLFVIPPAMLPAPKTVTVVTSMPPSLATIFPVLLLTMLPRKVPTLVSSMPACPAEMVPAFVIPPAVLPAPEDRDGADVDAPVAGKNLSGAAVDDAAEKSPNTGQVDARVTRGNGAPVRYPPAGAAAAEDRNGAQIDAGAAGENAPGVVDAAGKRDRILYDDTAGAGGDFALTADLDAAGNHAAAD
jgi:hypothetical protein